GLVVWQDETHFLRLFRAWMPAGGPFVHPEWYAGEPANNPTMANVPDQPTHLRVRRVGGRLDLAASLDGQTWTAVTTAPLPRAARVRVGVAVVSSVNQDMTARFEGFTVRPYPDAASP